MYLGMCKVQGTYPTSMGYLKYLLYGVAVSTDGGYAMALAWAGWYLHEKVTVVACQFNSEPNVD